MCVCACALGHFSHVRLCATLWTVACQAGDLPHPRIEPSLLPSASWAGRFFTTSAIWEAPPHPCIGWFQNSPQTLLHGIMLYSPSFSWQVLAHSKDLINAVQKESTGASLAVPCLELCASRAGGVGSVPGWGTKISQTVYAQPKK